LSIRNIQVFVDALALASGELHERAVFLVDDHPESIGRGTLALHSLVAPGDLVRWSVIPIDLQAPAFIRALTFAGARAGTHFRDADATDAEPPVDASPVVEAASPVRSHDVADTPEADTADVGSHAAPGPAVGRSLIWEGIVPAVATADATFPYVLHLAFTDRHPMTIRVDGPALRVRTPGAPPPEPGSLLAADDVL